MVFGAAFGFGPDAAFHQAEGLDIGQGVDRLFFLVEVSVEINAAVFGVHDETTFENPFGLTFVP